MLQSTIERAAEYYGLDYKQIMQVQSGYRNSVYPVKLRDGSMVNLLIYKSEPGILQTIKHTNRITSALADSKLPVRRAVDPRILKLNGKSVSGKDIVRYACLYNYLPGTTIPWEAYTMSHIKLIGKTLAILHQAMKQIPVDDVSTITLVEKNLSDQMQHYFKDPGVSSAMARKLKLSINSNKLNRACQFAQTQTADTQLLHMDFVRGNILFEDNTEELGILYEKGVKISGILDFEKVCYGSPLHDIARTLAFLLVDCKYKSAAKIQKYFLHSGYIKRGQGKIQDIDQLSKYVVHYLCYDFYKFLLHNPYESLKNNEHYIRTRDLLLGAGVVSRVGDS